MLVFLLHFFGLLHRFFNKQSKECLRMVSSPSDSLDKIGWRKGSRLPWSLIASITQKAERCKICVEILSQTLLCLVAVFVVGLQGSLLAYPKRVRKAIFTLALHTLASLATMIMIIWYLVRTEYQCIFCSFRSNLINTGTYCTVGHALTAVQYWMLGVH
jgi:hypothetical protein